MHAIPERLRDVSCIGAVQINITFTFTSYRLYVISETNVSSQALALALTANPEQPRENTRNTTRSSADADKPARRT